MNMASKSVITYIPPKDRFVRVSNNIVTKYEPDVVGVYCKIIYISGGKSLSIDFISKKLNVGERKVRRIIVFLEDEGYVVRKAIKDGKGAFCGWNYCIYAEPVPKSERSHAGKKKEDNNIGLTPKWTSPETDKSQNGQENTIIDNNDIHYSNKEIEDNNIKKSPNGDKKEDNSLSLFPEQQSEEMLFESYMKQHYPHIMRMEYPLTLKQAKALKAEYGEDMVISIFESMENYKKLNNNRYAYKTVIAWIKKRKGESA